MFFTTELCKYHKKRGTLKSLSNQKREERKEIGLKYSLGKSERSILETLRSKKGERKAR